jgi:hypothetical protein
MGPIYTVTHTYRFISENWRRLAAARMVVLLVQEKEEKEKKEEEGVRTHASES